MNEEQELKKYREEINEIDDTILNLVSKRASIALEVAATKLKYHGKGASMYRPEREQEIRNRLSQNNSGPLDNAAVCRIAQVIIEECKALEHKHAN